MKLTRIFGLAAIAAIAATALAGASPALASTDKIVFCEAAELECGRPFPNPLTVTGHATATKLLSSLGTVECEKSLAVITILNELGSLIIGHALSLTLEGCKLGKTACTVTVNTLGLYSFTHGPIPLEADGKLTGGTTKTVVCGALLNCKYGGEPVLRIHSSASGETKLLGNKATLTEIGEKFICPDTMELDIDYNLLGAIYIES